MKDRILKYASVSELAISDDELAKINKLAIRELSAGEVFTFKVAICDNEVDRDFEYFPVETLKELAELFKGKTVISDHRWTSKNQVARIYDTAVTEIGGTTKSGEEYTQLIAKCYMLKTESNSEIISAIEAGIIKEVSIGCSVKSAVCSICGLDNRETYCKHFNGREYDGKICYFALKGAKDAYELSFVAVPAQRNAGVTKAYGEEPIDYKAEPPDSEKPNTEAEVLTLSLENVGAFLFAKKSKLTLEEKIHE